MPRKKNVSSTVRPRRSKRLATLQEKQCDNNPLDMHLRINKPPCAKRPGRKAAAEVLRKNIVNQAKSQQGLPVKPHSLQHTAVVPASRRVVVPATTAVRIPLLPGAAGDPQPVAKLDPANTKRFFHTSMDTSPLTMTPPPNFNKSLYPSTFKIPQMPQSLHTNQLSHLFDPQLRPHHQSQFESQSKPKPESQTESQPQAQPKLRLKLRLQKPQLDESEEARSQAHCEVTMSDRQMPHQPRQHEQHSDHLASVVAYGVPSPGLPMQASNNVEKDLEFPAAGRLSPRDITAVPTEVQTQQQGAASAERGHSTPSADRVECIASADAHVQSQALAEVQPHAAEVVDVVEATNITDVGQVHGGVPGDKVDEEKIERERETPQRVTATSYGDSTVYLSSDRLPSLPLAPLRVKKTLFQRALDTVWKQATSLVKMMFDRQETSSKVSQSVTSWSSSQQPYWP